MLKMLKSLKKLIYIIAFIEGGAVMCVELCGAKMLSPFFGTSIYVWAAVLGITLTALMTGYYLGGYVSNKFPAKDKLIYWFMLVAGFLVTISPSISAVVLPITINLNILLGTIVSLMSFLFLPLMLFGAISPLIINLLTQQAKESGKSSGTVYAVSTLGGIISTFFIGFYTLPQFGIKNTLYCYGLLAILIGVLFLAKNNKNLSLISLISLAALFSYNFNNSNNNHLLYHADSILGEVKVVDRIHFNPKTKKNTVYRELIVNNISQTIMDKENPFVSYWDYVDVLTNNVNTYAQGKKTLLLGLGGGTLYKQLKKNNLTVNVVEIDERIAKIAKKYFYINKNVNVIVDDARHYLNLTKKKYDVIIYDLYHSETPPIHLMTKEAFAEIKTKLTKKGILIVNFYGYITGSKGKAARSIYKTLLADNYHVQLVATKGKENARNLLFIASKEKLVSKNKNTSILISKKDINLNDAVILTDDKPILEHIYLEAALDWRKNYNEVNAKYFLQKR